jgi:hypothetical protein
MAKLRRFFAEAGKLGMGGVIFAFFFWVISLIEHVQDKNIPALRYFVCGCVAFCFGCFMAWRKADDRANERRPKLGFSADYQAFYITHLGGDPARFIEIEPIAKQPENPHSTKLHFDPVDFLSSAMTACQKALSARLEILPGEKIQTDMGKVLAVMFSAYSQPSASFPVKIRFRWDQEEVEEQIMLTWISEEKRFETKPLHRQ